jgi:hypothetical protein
MAVNKGLSGLDAQAWAEAVADARPMKRPTAWAFSLFVVQFWCSHAKTRAPSMQHSLSTCTDLH